MSHIYNCARVSSFEMEYQILRAFDTSNGHAIFTLF